MKLNGNQAAKAIGNLRRGKNTIWAGGKIISQVMRNRERPNAIFLYLIERDGTPCGAMEIQIDEMVSIQPTFDHNYVVLELDRLQS